MDETFEAAVRRTGFLVIDESRFARLTVAEALRALGASRIESVAGVAEAVERLRFAETDVVLLEWGLPVLSGIEFTRMIRAGFAPLKRDAGVVLVTSRSTRSDVEAARRWGVDEFLAKPFSINSLERRLREVLLHRRAFVEGATYLGPCRRRQVHLDYRGPMRRLLDASEEHVTPARRAAAEVAREHLKGARAVASGLSSPVRLKLREFYGCAQMLASVALEVHDPCFSEIVDSLGHYLSGVGAGPHFEKAVVEAHLDAAEFILANPNANEDARRDVVAELGRLVRRRLSRIRAA